MDSVVSYFIHLDCFVSMNALANTAHKFVITMLSCYLCHPVAALSLVAPLLVAPFCLYERVKARNDTPTMDHFRVD